jgi:hypothetical protein
MIIFYMSQLALQLSRRSLTEQQIFVYWLLYDAYGKTWSGIGHSAFILDDYPPYETTSTETLQEELCRAEIFCILPIFRRVQKDS